MADDWETWRHYVLQELKSIRQEQMLLKATIADHANRIGAVQTAEKTSTRLIVALTGFIIACGVALYAVFAD